MKTKPVYSITVADIISPIALTYNGKVVAVTIPADGSEDAQWVANAVAKARWDKAESKKKHPRPKPHGYRKIGGE